MNVNLETGIFLEISLKKNKTIIFYVFSVWPSFNSSVKWWGWGVTRGVKLLFVFSLCVERVAG